MPPFNSNILGGSTLPQRFFQQDFQWTVLEKPVYTHKHTYICVYIYIYIHVCINIIYAYLYMQKYVLLEKIQHKYDRQSRQSNRRL